MSSAFETATAFLAAMDELFEDGLSEDTPQILMSPEDAYYLAADVAALLVLVAEETDEVSTTLDALELN